MTRQEQIRMNPFTGKPMRVTSKSAAKRHAGKLLDAQRHLRTTHTDLRPMHADARAVLERNAAATQAALDEYLATVADARVLGPLKAARNGARSALAAFDAQRGTT